MPWSEAVACRSRSRTNERRSIQKEAEAIDSWIYIVRFTNQREREREREIGEREIRDQREREREREHREVMPWREAVACRSRSRSRGGRRAHAPLR